MINEDDDAIQDALRDDPNFYFDENNFSTLVLHSEEFAHKHVDEIKNLVELISSNERDEREEALKILKKENGAMMLLSSIASKEFREHRPKLIAACWESGLDFTEHFEFFLHLALTGDFSVSMEAVTVIENMEGKIPDDLRSIAITKMEEGIAAENEKSELYKVVLQFLRSAEE
jgi:hypothetical protein